MNKKILIIYIATGKYNNYSKAFIDSCEEFFLINHICNICYVSDEFARVHNLGYVIEEKPWPLTALMKFHYIKKGIDMFGVDYDYVFYFNANTKFLAPITDEVFLTDKLIAIPHHSWLKNNKDTLSFTFGKRVDSKSKAYIDSDDYLYHNSGIFGGPIKLMEEACKSIVDNVNYDLCHNRIPVWHDESYWNKFIYDNNDLVITLDQCYSVDESNSWEMSHVSPKIVFTDSYQTQVDKDKYFK